MTLGRRLLKLREKKVFRLQDVDRRGSASSKATFGAEKKRKTKFVQWHVTRLADYYASA